MLTIARRVAARAPTYGAYIKERPGWALLIVFGRLKWARRLERMIRARPPLDRPIPRSAVLDSPDGPLVAEKLRLDGVCEGFRLDEAMLGDIRAFAEANPCQTRDQETPPFLAKDIDAVNRTRDKDVLAAYYFSSIERCASITRLTSDARLTAIAENYVGQKVTNIRARLWWNFPGTRFDEADLHATAQDRFHFDLNDWRTLKFFFYITDVDGLSAPHMYVRGSHVRRKLLHQYTILQGKPEKDLEDFYGAEEFRTITGPAGSGFAEDPFVFHTGSRSMSVPRLILELEFGPYDPSPSYRYGVLG